jgi:hypothetical protein
MKLAASDSRIEFLTFGKSGADQLEPPPPVTGRTRRWWAPLEARVRRVKLAVQPAAASRAKVAVDTAFAFDVRMARATLATDTERLLAVIDCCGNGFDSFNEWMAAGLREWRAAGPQR